MKYLILTFFLFSSSFCFGQKTKILLLGTIHFETPHKDKNELTTDDFLSEKRQDELEQLTKLLAQTNANKVMIERPYENQSLYDSLYNSYLNNTYSLSVSEREQIGFRLAKKLNLKHINCVDQIIGFPHDSIMTETIKSENQGYVLDSLNKDGQNMVKDFDKAVKEKTVIGILKYINSDEQLSRNLALYLKHFAKIGNKSNLSGAEYVSDWYLRNIAIYSTILSQITSKDQYVVVVFGQGHIQILRHLFENNPDFKVVNVDSILK